MYKVTIKASRFDIVNVFDRVAHELNEYEFKFDATSFSHAISIVNDMIDNGYSITSCIIAKEEVSVTLEGVAVNV